MKMWLFTYPANNRKQKSQTFVWLEDILVAAQGFSASRNDMLPSGGGCAVALLQSRTAGAEPRQ